MSGDKLDLLGPALARVGEEIMHDIGGEPDGIYLYVEIGEGWVRASLFKDEGDKVRYTHDGWDLAHALMDAWCLEPADKRWTAMHYTIEGGKFDAKFDYADLEHSNETIDERRERILNARYGNKPRVYPPMRAGATELTPPS